MPETYSAVARGPHSHPLDRFCERWVQLGGSKITMWNYRRHVRLLWQSYPNTPVESMSAEHIERHLYNRPVGARSKCAELAGIKAFFRYLIKERFIKSNPCEDIARPKYRQKQMPCPTFGEFVQMFNKAESLEEKVILNLFFQSAVRLREGIRLRIRQVKVSEREIHVEQGKGNKDRVSVFDPETLPAGLKLAPLLEQWIGTRGPEEWLFPARQGSGPRSHVYVQRVIHRLGKEIGLPFRLTPHALRHGWTMWSAECELPIDVAQTQLGHVNISTTAGVYRKMTGPRLRRAIDKHMSAPGIITVPNNKPLDKPIAPVYTRGVTTETKVQTKDTTSLQIGKDVHEIVRELAYLERRTIRSLIEEAVQKLKATRQG